VSARSGRRAGARGGVVVAVFRATPPISRRAVITLWPLFTLTLRRRRWAQALEHTAPAQCTLSHAATLLGVDVTTLEHAVSQGLDRPVTASTLLSSREIVTALRATHQATLYGNDDDRAASMVRQVVADAAED
jgi:hypothetical protein